MRKPLAVLALIGALQLNSHAQDFDYSKYFSTDKPTAVQASKSFDPEFRIKMANAELAYDARKLDHFAEILANAQGMEYHIEEGKSARPYSETLIDLLKGASERDPSGKTLLEHVKGNPAYFIANAIEDFYETQKSAASSSPIRKIRKMKIDGIEQDVAVIDKRSRGEIAIAFTSMISWQRIVRHGTKLDYETCLRELDAIMADECAGQKSCTSNVVTYVKSQLEQLNDL
jgi:hypothetical protein